MNDTCTNRIPWETLVDYWAGDLPPDENDRIEDHLFGCAPCTTEAARVASVTETMRGMIPPAVTRARLDELRAAGVRIRENPFAPGDRREVVFASDADLLIHRLSGLDLAGAERVSVQVSSESTGQWMTGVDNAPFEPAEGAVLIACQRHFASLPPDTRFDVSIHVPGQPVRTAAYTILHLFG